MNAAAGASGRWVGASGLPFEARLLQRAGAWACASLDARLLEDALAGALAAGAQGVVSFGCAAGLAPALRAGDLVLAESVVAGDDVFVCDSVHTERLARAWPKARRGTVAAVRRPLESSAAKEEAHRSHGALAADMESGIAARLAQRHGVPLVVCRVVLDDVRRAVPSAALVGLRADGSTHLPRLLAELWAFPDQIAPLITLAVASARARRTLARAAAAFASGDASPAALA